MSTGKSKGKNVRGVRTKPELDFTFTLRRLEPRDAEAYRTLRLHGLRAHPEAFGRSYAEEARMPLEVFTQRLESGRHRWTWGAFDGTNLMGVVSLLRGTGAKERHKAMLVGMHVASRYAGRGIGRALLGNALAIAQTMRGLRQVALSVTETNTRACRLYQKAGFVIFGREHDSLYVRGRYLAELHLAKRLR